MAEDWIETRVEAAPQEARGRYGITSSLAGD